MRPVAADDIAPVFAVHSEQVPAIDWGPSGKRVEVLNLLDDRIG